PASKASYSASLLVDSNWNLRAYVYSFPSRLTNIIPSSESSKLEALSVYNFHMLSMLGTLLVVVGFLVSVSLSSTKGVSARKLARICPLTELRPLNSRSCSPSLIAYLAILPDFSGLARICLMGLLISTLMG
nr:hypothetical protein [Tanacetum cinerariifolium]